MRVPLGNREVLGVVWDSDAATGELPPDGATLRAIGGVLEGVAPLDLPLAPPGGLHGALLPAGLGEVALAALPPQLRDLKPEQLARRLRRPALAADDSGNAIENIALTAEQESARAQIASNPGPFLLFGSTGSGKTEVYLRCVQEDAGSRPHRQALVMVPRSTSRPSWKSALSAALRRALAQARWCRCTAA